MKHELIHEGLDMRNLERDEMHCKCIWMTSGIRENNRHQYFRKWIYKEKENHQSNKLETSIECLCCRATCASSCLACCSEVAS